MFQMIASLILSLLATFIGYSFSKVAVRKGKDRNIVIEFSEENGKKQRLKVSSLNPSMIKEAVESELKLENFIRNSLKELTRSNGTLKIEESNLADFIITSGERTLIIEAKASIDNLTDDFFNLIEKKYNNYYAIILVNKLSNSTKNINDNIIKIIRKNENDSNFKKHFINEVLAALNK